MGRKLEWASELVWTYWQRITFPSARNQNSILWSSNTYSTYCTNCAAWLAKLYLTLSLIEMNGIADNPSAFSWVAAWYLSLSLFTLCSISSISNL